MMMTKKLISLMATGGSMSSECVVHGSLMALS